MKSVDIYTDGACSGNPGPGGWAAILLYNGHRMQLSGYQPDTTNNRMELFAVIQGLSALKQRCYVRLHSDSAYVVNAFNDGWIDGWLKTGRLEDGHKKAVSNPDLWRLLLVKAEGHVIEWVKVPGHADNEENNNCDALARGEIERMKTLLEENGQ